MAKAPDDKRFDESRAWSSVSIDKESDLHELLKRFALIGHIDPRSQIFSAYGSGFIIGGAKTEANEGAVVVCTAAHVVLHAERCLVPSVERHGGNFFAPEPGELLGKGGRIRGLAVFLWTGDGFKVHSADSGYLNRHMDVAYVIAKTGRPPSTKENPQPTFTINSDEVKVGTPIATIGMPFFGDADGKPPDLKLTITPQGQYVDRRVIKYLARAELTIRRGKISAIMQRGHLVSIPVYQTTISAPGGMSGAPVMVLRSDGRFSPSAIGVLSHDLPDEEEPDDYSRPGRSFVIPAAFIHCLPASSTTNPPTFVRLTEKKLVRDVGKLAARLTVQYDPETGIRLDRQKV